MRHIGAPIATTYNPYDWRPFDTRQLVETFADLINKDTWLVKYDESYTESYAYNGMIVAVGCNKDSKITEAGDVAEAGVYYLLDYKHLDNEEQYADPTNPANWHKLANLNELNTLKDRVAELEGKGITLDETSLSAVITALGYYTDKGDKALSALLTDVQSNTDAIKALYDADNKALSINALLTSLNTVISDELTIDENKRLILNKVPISKLVIDVDEVRIVGGSATGFHEKNT